MTTMKPSLTPLEFDRIIKDTIINHKLRPAHHQLSHLLDYLPFEVKEILNAYISNAPYMTKSALILPGLTYLKLDTYFLLKYGFPEKGDVYDTNNQTTQD